MRKQVTLSIVLLLLVAGSARAADDLKVRLKKLSKIVDEMALLIEKQDTEDEAEFYGRISKMELEKSLAGYKAVVQVKAHPGVALIMIYTSNWRMWSMANGGRITEHGIKMK